MPATDGPDDAARVKQLAVTLVDAYVRKDADALAAAVAGIGGATAEVTSDLKVFAAFLTRRVQETGVVWKPADAREAVAAAVADMLPPEIEFAVVTAWEAYSVGEEAVAERFTNGDPWSTSTCWRLLRGDRRGGLQAGRAHLDAAHRRGPG